MVGVEMFIVGALFIWLVVSGKLKAILDAGFGNTSSGSTTGNKIVNPP